jgi:hypothetical protein
MQVKGTAPEKLKKIIQDRYKTNYYKAPERAGISYMMSPILKTYTNPDADDNVVTSSNPHVMHYAPNVTNQDVGRAKPSFEKTYPFVTLHGPHRYTIQNAGEKERAAINKEYEEMLARLCKIKKEWCLPISNGLDQTPMHKHD